MPADDKNTKVLTPSETAFIISVLRNTETRLTVSWDNVAQETNMKLPRSARERWRLLSVKHSFGGLEALPKKPSTIASPQKITKKKPVKGKRVKKEETEIADEQTEEEDVANPRA